MFVLPNYNKLNGVKPKTKLIMIIYYMTPTI